MSKNVCRQGFTLLELLVVLAVVAILAALATPDVLAWRQSARFRAVTREVYGSFLQAKTEAVKRNRRVALRFQDGTGPAAGIDVFVDDGAGGGEANNHIRDGAEVLLGTVALPPGVAMGNVTFTGRSTAFSPAGLTTYQGRICIGNGTRAMELRLSQAGFLRENPVASCP